MTGPQVTALVVAALGGAAVGVERQWSGHAEGERARFGGLRTFTMLGLVGGIAGLFQSQGQAWPGALLVGAAGALVVAAYAAASRHDVDGTTEVAALVVLGAGVLAGAGEVRLASGVIAVTVLLLVEKSRLHAMVRLMDDRGFRAGARFAVLALVVLPLLPEGPYGPLGGIRPRALWALVLFFSGLSFAGYVARTLVGNRYGYAVTGLLAGLVSSTNATWTFARLSRTLEGEGTQLAAGVMAACTMLFVRVAVAVSVLEDALLPALLPLMAAPAAAGAAAVWLLVRRRGPDHATLAPPANPLRIADALQMAALFQLVLFALELASRWFGSTGVLASAALLGLTDADALTMSVASRVRDGLAVSVGAAAIAVGIMANTVTKLAIAVAVGRGRFRLRAGAGLAAILLAGVAAIAALGRLSPD